MKNSETENYIKSLIYSKAKELSENYGISFSENKINQIIKDYVSSDKEIKTIEDEINKNIGKIAQQFKLKKKLISTEKDKSFFGETYKSYVIHVLDIYEKISSSDISTEEKKKLFESQLKTYLNEKKVSILEYSRYQSSDSKRLKLAETEVLLGAESLNYESVGNLFNTFNNDINIVSNDFEGKMFNTVVNHQKIFDEHGEINKNIEYNFDMVKETYDFSKKHGKQVKFHTFLWHNAIPENLKFEIDNISDPIQKRKMTLKFLDDYATKLSNFIKKNDYDLRQIEALNEIANDSGEEKLLRDSWWKDVIGNNPENNDEYFIDVLKIIKNNFPDVEVIYNEYNEFLNPKNRRICEIINYIKNVEDRDNIKLMDGIGLQGHYIDFIKEQKRPLNETDIIESAVNIQDACTSKNGNKKIYITEFDFIDILQNGTKDILMKSFIDTYSKIANGFITWGQSDSLTWYHCINPTTKENFNAHIIDMNGVPKKEWNILKKIMNPEEKNKNVCINEYEGIVRKDEVKNNKFIEELQNQVNTDITQFKSSENNKKEKEMSLDDVVR